MPLRNLAIDFDSFFASVEQQDRPELRVFCASVPEADGEEAPISDRSLGGGDDFEEMRRAQELPASQSYGFGKALQEIEQFARSLLDVR